MVRKLPGFKSNPLMEKQYIDEIVEKECSEFFTTFYDRNKLMFKGLVEDQMSIQIKEFSNVYKFCKELERVINTKVLYTHTNTLYGFIRLNPKVYVGTNKAIVYIKQYLFNGLYAEHILILNNGGAN